MNRSRCSGAFVVLLAPLLLACVPPSASAAQTTSFVLSYFYPANYYGDDTCPEGLNPLPDVFFRRDLRILGLPQAEVDAMFNKDYNIQNGHPTTKWVAVVATRGNGRDNVYLHPTTVPDAHLKPAVGRFAYGFNLDATGLASANSYEDPETHEKGINNQLFHALGCIQAYKGYPPPQPPLEAEYRWDYSRAVMGAWLISISGEDLSKDGDVTVRLETSIDPVTIQDANAHVQSDMDSLRQASQTHTGMYFYWKQYGRRSLPPSGDKHQADDIGHNLSWEAPRQLAADIDSFIRKGAPTRDLYRTDAPADVHKIVVEPDRAIIVSSVRAGR